MKKIKRSAASPWALLAVVVLAGAYLRLANLGDLGFRWDEDLSGLAVQAILEQGVPELPSGMIYLRGGPFLYAMAASAQVFGFSEFALRLPAALFGILLIPAGFFFARALFDTRVGLVVAALISISFWDIELARYARMYAPFSFFYLLTLHCLWKYRVARESIAGGCLCVGLALVAISLHELGYTLVIAMFYPLLVSGPEAWRTPRPWGFPLAASTATAAFFFFWRGVMAELRHLPTSGPGAVSLTAGGGESDAFASLVGMLPDLPLLANLVDRAPVLAVVLIGLLVATAGAYALRYCSTWAERLLVMAVAVCCALQLINFALLAVVALAWSKRVGLAVWRDSDAWFALGIVIVSCAAWIALSLGLGLTEDLRTGLPLRETIRALIDYPHLFIFWGFPKEWPLLSLVASIGALWAFDRSSRAPWLGRSAETPSAGVAATFLLLALTVPLIANGLFEAPFELFRYNVPYDTFFFCLVGLGLLRWYELLPVEGLAIAMHAPRRALAAASTAMLVLLVVGIDMNPLRGWLAVQRQYYNEGFLYRAFGITQYNDFKTTAAFVAESAAPEDIIIALDSREYFNYLGRLDYWLRSGRYEGQSYKKDGTVRDLYIDTPVISDLEQLRATLAAPEHAKWLIASDNVLARPASPVADEIKQFIREHQEQVVYVGLDRDRKVYRFE